jgi:chemotaxis protein methyltransferase CheR
MAAELAGLVMPAASHTWRQTAFGNRSQEESMRNDPWRAHRHLDVTLAMPHGRTSNGSDNGPSPTQPIMETIREPLLLLDRDLRVTAANCAFCLTFGLRRHDVIGRPVHALGDGQWNIPDLRTLLERILPRHTVMDAYEVEQEFSGLGRRTMLLTAREVSCEQGSHPTILLAIEDITERRAIERALRELVQEKNALLQEIPHRVATSMQIVASVLHAGARTAGSEETPQNLEDAHSRVMALSALQRLLRDPDSGAKVMVAPYLSRLCEILAPVEVGGRRPVFVQVQAGHGTVSSGQAVSIGLAVTELVVNALEHAFPDAQDDGTVIVSYDQAGPDWTLTVSDNGIGRPEDQWDEWYPGLGTIILKALVNRLDARMEVEMDTHGTTVSVIHGAAFASRRSAAYPVWQLDSMPGVPSRTKPVDAMPKDKS